MKKSIYLSIALIFAITISRAQTTAMQFSGLDCNGNTVDLFADLDAGKAVLLHFYMPNCGSCPPPAQKIQAMANKINATHPGAVKGYAFPYQNSTTCAYSANWVNVAGVSAIYTPMDSGALQVAYYGGFGMPTVVLLGGSDHRIMYSTLSFIGSDTTIMRDSILNMLNTPAAINEVARNIADVILYPNPASNKIELDMDINKAMDIKIDIINELGNVVANVSEKKIDAGNFKKEVSTASLSNGVYYMRISSEGKYKNYKFSVMH